MSEESDDVKNKIIEFTELLNSIKNLSDKRRSLWLQVYENAVHDRQNAFTMFMKLATITDTKSNEHAVHGRTMTTYIEKMSKANDQLLKLAELINSVTEQPKEEILSAADLYKKIGSS